MSLINMDDSSLSLQQIKDRISAIGLVVPRHTESSHWYEIPLVGCAPVVPSVTNCLGIINDPYIKNKDSEEVILKRDEAGQLGTAIHEVREEMFKGNSVASMPQLADSRVVSGARALKKFLQETSFYPVASEVKVYDYDKRTGWGVAGSIDDIGLMPVVAREGDAECQHSWLTRNNEPIIGKMMNCYKCHRGVRYYLTLSDLKTSEQIRDIHYAQVGLYVKMFRKITKLPLSRVFILKVSKNDGTYKIENIENINAAIRYGESIVRTYWLQKKVQQLRKPKRIKLYEEDTTRYIV